MKPVDSRRRQRRLFLLLSAILIPAAVLITLSVRVVRQEAELAERRAAEERREARDQLRRELTARLQAIKLEEVNRLIGDSGPGLPPDSPIVFVTSLGQDRMALPWEAHRRPRRLLLNSLDSNLKANRSSSVGMMREAPRVLTSKQSPWRARG